MVNLINIQKRESIIECDILPEDSIEYGHIIVDLSSEKVLQYKLPPGYEWCTNHIAHARIVLLRLSEDSKIPNEKLVMWY